MDFLNLKIEDNVAWVTLNRPEVYNAFNDEMSYELQDVLKSLAVDENIRVVVLTGAGKAFCSGQDLKASTGLPKRSFIGSLQKRYNPIILAMRKMPKPIICRLNGVAAGAGCSLALACDIIVASEEASMVEVFINIGLVPDSGSSFFLPQVIGYPKAFEICTMGNKMTASEALQMGLINRVVPLEALDDTVRIFTGYFSKAPTRSIGMIKKMLNKALSSSLEDMLEYEAYCQEIAGNTDDYKEGVDAFLGKRTPLFKGK